MCQLNLYCVPKTVDPEKVVKILNESFNCSVAEHLGDGDYFIEGLEEKYNFFACAGMRCNCGSIISRFQCHDNTLNWKELKQNLVNAEFEKLNKVKTLLESPDYKKRLAEYEKTQKRLWAECEKTSRNIAKLEEKLTSQIMDRTDISDKEKSRLMHEQVYPEINRLHMENEKQPNRMAAMKKYQEFMQKNNDLITSSLYTTKKVVSEKLKFASDNGEEIVQEITIVKNIYDAIEEAKQTSHNQEEAEFAEIKDAIKNLLEVATEVKLMAFWQDDEPIKVNQEYKVKLADFDILDVIYLEYKDLLTITKQTKTP